MAMVTAVDGKKITVTLQAEPTKPDTTDLTEKTAHTTKPDSTSTTNTTNTADKKRWERNDI